MRIDHYVTFDEMWYDAVSHLRRQDRVPCRNGAMRECTGYVARLEYPRDGWLWNPVRKASAVYAAAELLWYFSGSAGGEMISAYAPSYTNYLSSDGTAHGAYGKRWSDCDGLRDVIMMMAHAPNTRQCFLASWAPSDLRIARMGAEPDIPCTIGLQFIPRGDALNLVATMRSNDVWLGMPYDVWCFTTIQRIVADANGMDVGWYQHQVGSLHLYEKDEERAAKVKPCHGVKRRSSDIMQIVDGCEALDYIADAVALEESVRARALKNLDLEKLTRNDLMAELVCLCASKFGYTMPDWIEERLVP